MSRTVRRKNVNYSSSYWDRYPLVHRVFYGPGKWDYDYEVIDKNKDLKAWKKAYWKAHKESSTSNERTPNRWHRQKREAQHKGHAKRELHKFATINEYEVIIEDNPRSHYWDWS